MFFKIKIFTSEKLFSLFFRKRQVLGYPNTTTLASIPDVRVASVLL